MTFTLESVAVSAGEFHHTDLLAAARPRVVVCDPARPAMVLGSRQTEDVLDVGACAAEDVEIVRRRSGGGAVLVNPGAMCWFDVVVPAAEPGFADVAADVGASMRWLGDRVADALQALGVADVHAHHGPMACTPWSLLVCFDGVGPGEVMTAGGKLVGVSQRRTRVGSRFQCMVHARWAPERTIRLLAAPRPRADELAPVAVTPPDVAAALPAALVRVLNS